MKKAPVVWITLAMMGALIISWPAVSGAADLPKQLDRAVCDSVQSQIDEVVSLSKSTSLTPKEKMERLTRVWTDAAIKMQESAPDKDAAALASQLIGAMSKVVNQAAASAKAGETEASQGLKRDFDDMKKQTKTLTEFMKLLCPDIKLPEG